MLVAAAVCPHPPLLVPELAAGAAGEMDDVRARCRAAVGRLVDASPDLLAVVGADIGPHASSFAPWGVDVAVDVPEPLPLSLLVGGWLTRGVVRSFVAVSPDLDADECASLGAELAAAADRVALLVMGDGSARHSEKAPGYLDPRAAPYDEHVADALARADAGTLLSLQPGEADELLVAGRAPWQVLAGAAGDGDLVAHDAFFAAPYGVGYHLVTWQ
ncbi:MAG TPA: class III extradiol dioxygenase subunit B-like domain-containing protein [Mycobacteriales bacterium]|nr:class III extradiol dioxygenase subunit B-like domain-containing protein [Mycobacteriales bacterium]